MHLADFYQVNRRSGMACIIPKLLDALPNSTGFSIIRPLPIAARLGKLSV
jgi:hypothetical protein